MLSKLLHNLLGSNSKINSKLQNKISKMDLRSMRLYVNGQLKKFRVSQFGLNEVTKRLTKLNESTEKYFLKASDMDSKKKKVFDLIILILENKKASIAVVESIQEFLEVYDEIIKKYDKDNKEIYETRIKDSMSVAIDRINIESNIIQLMEISKYK